MVWEKLPVTTLDAIALGFFAIAWIGFSYLVDRSPLRSRSLTAQMDQYRRAWMRVMTTRDLRMVDTSVIAGLQQGTAFFASASLIAIGGSLGLLSAADMATSLFRDLPFGLTVTRTQWELKVATLIVILVYAFFKFAWAYRMFNYCSILIGATPMVGKGVPGEADAMAERAAAINVIAGGHFNRGMRAVFFAVPVLGWFLSPWAFIATTASVLFVVVRRQFFSRSLKAVAGAT